MSRINVTNARKTLYKIIDAVNESHEPIHITSRNNSAVLIGEADWRSIEETLYLLSIKGMRNSIIKGMNTPLEDLETELDW